MLRARETKRPYALFSDPFAEELAGGIQIHSNYLYRKYGRLRADGKLQGEGWREQAAKAAKEDMEKRERRPFIAVRTRWIDDAIREQVKKAPLPQLVILGSGLDTRSHRLPCLQNTTIYELDRVHILRYKKEKLKQHPPSCTALHYIAAELSEGFGKTKKTKGRAPTEIPWVASLMKAGFDPKQKTMWVCEGLLMYFGKNQVGMILRLISLLSAQGSVICADVPNKAAVRSHVSYYRLFRWGCDQGGMEAFWAQNGRWSLVVAPFGRKGINYERCQEDEEVDSVTFPNKPPRIIRQHFVLGRKTSNSPSS